MILTALARYSPPDAVPFGYAAKPLGYTLVLSEDGQRVRLDAHHNDQKASRQQSSNIARTVKATPLLGCDNAAYVLGVSKDGEAPAKTAVKHGLFVDLIRALHSRTPHPIAAAFLAWDESGRPGLDKALEQLTGKTAQRLHMDLISLAVDGHPGRLHDSPAARAFWAEHAREGPGRRQEMVRSASPVGCSGRQSARCLSPSSAIWSRGRPRPMSRWPASTSVRPLAEALARGCARPRSAPTAQPTRCRASTTSPPAASRPGAPRRMTTASSGGLPMPGSPSSPEASSIQPDRLFASCWTGCARDVKDPGDRGARSVLSPRLLRQCRPFRRPAVARDPRHRIARLRVASWFSDCQTPSAEHPYRSVDAYAASLGILRKDQGKWVESPPHGSVEALVQAALSGATVPPNYLSLALSPGARGGAAAALQRRPHDLFRSQADGGPTSAWPA